MSRERRGLQDGSDRSATIARWLSTPVGNDNVSELVLLCWRMDEQPNILTRWQRKEVTRDLAPEIDAFIRDFADDEGANCRAKLAWRLPDGQEWCSKMFRALTSTKLDRTDQLDATPTSVVMQLQRHNEAVTQMLIEVVSGVEKRYMGIFELMDRQLARTNELLEAAYSDRDELASTAEAAAQLAEEATKTAEAALEEAEQAKADDKVAKVIDIAVKSLVPPVPTKAGS